MKLTQKSALAAVGLAGATALILTGCSGSSSSSSSASVSPTSSSASPTTSPTTDGVKLSTESYFAPQGSARANVTSGTIKGLVAKPSSLTATGTSSAGNFDFTFTVSSGGKVTAATLKLGTDTYQLASPGSGTVEFSGGQYGDGVSTTTPLVVTKNGGNGTTTLNFQLSTAS